uniref:30S ribosomal protein S16 n=1 Tax=Lygus hesperus TaxID=30085 RepID=A0A0A9ZDZ3_LYGHE
MSGHIGVQTSLSALRRKSITDRKIVGVRTPVYSLSLEDNEVSSEDSLLYSSQSSPGSASDSYDPIVVLEDDSSLEDRYFRRSPPSHTARSYLHPALQTVETYSDEESAEDFTMMSETERRWRRVDKKLEKIKKQPMYSGSSSGSLSSSPR